MKLLMSLALVGSVIAVLAVFDLISRYQPVLSDRTPPFGVSLLIRPTEGCSLAHGPVTYEADPVVGTTVRGMAVAWPVGFTARWIGDQVHVYNAKGVEFAVTGRLYPDVYGSGVRPGGVGGWPSLDREVFVPCAG